MAREMTRTGTLIGRHQPRRLLIWSGLITLAAIVALLTLWLRPGPPPPATTPALIGAIEDRVIASGTIVPSRSLDLSFQMSGVVTAVLAAEGEQVRTGQPLARLDDRDLRGRVAQLQADLASAEARREQARRGNATPEELRSAEASVASARAQLDRARTNNVTAADIAIAEAELRGAQARYDALAAGAGPEELSAAQARAEQTRASLEERRASLSAAKTSAESQVQQAANALRDAQAEYSRIYWDNRELEKLPGDLPPERLDQEAAAERAVANAEEGLRQARVAYEQARQAEMTGLAEAEAQLRDAEEQLRLLRAGPTATDLAQARAEVDQARANLDRLRQGGTAADVRTAEAAVAQAEANLAALTAPATASDLAIQEAAVLQAEQALRQAERELERATLRAPFPGVLAAVAVLPGSTVTANTPLISLIDRSTLLVELRLNETDVARLSVGQPVSLSIDALPDWAGEGMITAIAPAAEVVNDVVTYRVTVSFTDSDARIRVGMTAGVEIVAERRSGVVLVPSSALLPRGDAQIVQVLQGDGRLVERVVQTGLSDRTQTEIVAGLEAGEQVVTLPQLTLPSRGGLLGVLRPGGR